MEHTMKLLSRPFDRIKSGRKIVEIRLNDEKRKKLKVGDVIVFSKLPSLSLKIKVEVIGILKYDSFSDLISDLGVESFGYSKETLISDLIESCYTIYSKEQEKEFGVLGIKIKVID